VGPRSGKALAYEILFKVQTAGLELGSTPSQAQYKHLETESPTNSASTSTLNTTILFTKKKRILTFFGYYYYFYQKRECMTF